MRRFIRKVYSRIYDDVQEKARRLDQIARCQLQRENGLVSNRQVRKGKYATIIIGEY